MIDYEYESNNFTPTQRAWAYNTQSHRSTVETDQGAFFLGSYVNDSDKKNYFLAHSLNGKVTYNVNRCNGIAYHTTKHD